MSFMPKAAIFIISILQVVVQTVVLFMVPPSPFNDPTSPINVMMYGVIALFIVLAWYSRPVRR